MPLQRASSEGEGADLRERVLSFLYRHNDASYSQAELLEAVERADLPELMDVLTALVEQELVVTYKDSETTYYAHLVKPGRGSQ